MTNTQATIRLRVWFCISLLLLCACSEPQDDAIRFGLSAAPVNLDPRYATDAVSSRINRLLYRKLTDFDSHFQVQPQLADWEQIGPQHYRFRLKDDFRTFHDGSRLTAEDVKATYDSVLAVENGSPQRTTLTNILSIEVVDADTVDFHTREPDPLFPGRLVIGILPARLIASGHPFHAQPVGSGPFRFHSWPVEDRLVLMRDKDKLPVEFITVKDATVRALKLVRGEIDLIQGDLPFEMLDWLGKREGIHIENADGNVFTYIGFNLRDPALSQLLVRKAIACAIDRDSIIKFVLGGAAHRAGAILSPTHWAGHPGLHGYPYDPARSRALLQQAGFDHHNPLSLDYKTSNNTLRVRLATIIQYQLQQVGIRIELNTYDWGTFYGDIRSGRFQMFSLSWVGLNLPDIFRYVFHSTSVPPAGANRGYYADNHVDQLIEQAESAPSIGEQAAYYREIQEYLHDQLPYIPLWYEDNILARRVNLQGYMLTPDGDYDGLINVNRTRPQ